MASVYKYYSPTKNSRKAIQERYFWFSKAKSLNDPFDMCAKVITLFPCFEKVLCEKYGEIDSYYKKASQFGVCCFTTEPLNKHMWALYADSYKGWCLEFESNGIIDTSTTGVPARFYDVHYYEQLPDFNNPQTEIEVSTRSGSHILQDFLKDERDEETLFAYLLSLKQKSIWENEKEKRLFLGNLYYSIHPTEDKGAAGYKVPWQMGKQKSIIMGNNTSEEDVDLLRNIAERNQVRLLQVHPIVPTTSFSLQIETIKDFSQQQ